MNKHNTNACVGVQLALAVERRRDGRRVLSFIGVIEQNRILFAQFIVNVQFKVGYKQRNR